MNRKSPFVVVAALSCILAFVGCTEGTRGLGSGYLLESDPESGVYYVLNGSDDQSPGGVFEGTVELIGQTDNTVVCRIKRLASIDPDGWYSLDTSTRQVVGPIPEAELVEKTGIQATSCVPPSEFLSRAR